MIGAIIPYVQKIRRTYQSNDLADRLNYQYTAFMVVLGAMTLAATQYVGKPIQCWVPAQFTGAWEKYSETLCFIKGSYYLPDDENPENYFMSEEKREIDYYQWVPIVLAFQGFLFYLPCLIWRIFNTSTGINVKDVLDKAAKVKKDFTPNQREEKVSKAASHIQEALETQRELKLDAPIFSKLRKSGFYLCILYLFTKVLYVLNIFVQMAIFTSFLGTNDSFWGWHVFTNIVTGQSWEESGHFPRVTMCDFNVRVLGAVHRWTVQCVLMINMYTEKIYVFFWFWFILVGILSIGSLAYWLVAICFTNFQRDFVTKFLRCGRLLSSHPTREEEQNVNKFVKNFLTADGVLVLRFIQLNGGDVMASNLTCELYRNYQQRYETKADDSFDSPDTTATLPR